MRHRRHIFIVVLAVALPLALLIVLPPWIALTLQSPAGLLLLAFVAAGFAYVILGRNRTLKLVMVVFAFVVASVLLTAFLVMRGAQDNRIYSGTFEYGFERSNFYPKGQCWRPPYWLIPVPELHAQMNSMGASVKVRFIGDATSIGSYGHLGAYVRQVRVIKVLDVQPTQPCRQ